MLRYFPITGRLVLSDDTQVPPHVIFDTDEPFLCVKPDDVKTGSQVVPARTASSTGVDGTQTVVDIETRYLLAHVDIPGAKVVRGMMRSTWDSNPEPADNLWRQASGTHLDILDGVSTTQVPQSDLSGYNRVATMGGYTFEVDQLGNLFLRERIVIRARDPGGPPTSFNRARRQATISFRLLIGFFLDQDDLGASLPATAPLDARQMSGSLLSGTRTATCMAGYGFTGRRLVAIIHCRNSAIPTGVTIGGVTATKRGGNFSIGADGLTTVWDAEVETGTTVSVVATRGSNFAGFPGIELHGAKNISGAPTVDGTNNAGGNTVTHSVTVGADEVAAISANSGGVASVTPFRSLEGAVWTLTSRDDSSGGAGYVPRNAGSVSVSAAWTGPTGSKKSIVSVKYAA
jgi:hypothetical protein